jgi:hypothetical protein
MIYLTPFNVPLEEYEGLIGRREYWDNLADEWKSTSIEEKLVRLAGFVQIGGNLKKNINRYAKEKEEYKRQRIQHCILDYILRLMSGNRLHASEDIPLVNRIKRLDKNELVRLLSAELKRDVQKSVSHDKNYNLHENWQLLSDEKWMNDDILDKIERKHWHDNPDEDFNSYLDRAKIWWNGSRSLW